MILVTGATGQVGYHLLEALADAGAEATAMVRVPAKAEDLPGSRQHVVATLDGPPPAEVLRAFDRVFLLSPAHEGQVQLEMIFIDALLGAGHRPHIVKIAADGFLDPDCEVRLCAVIARSPYTWTPPACRSLIWRQHVHGESAGVGGHHS